MKCPDVIDQIPLYCYGELSSELEERIESHCAACPGCQEELARHRRLLSLLDEREDATDPLLLATCRMDLRRELHQKAARSGHGWMNRLRQFSQFHIPFRVPVGALALVAIGWFGARLTPVNFGGVHAGLAEPMFSTVRSVEPDSSGKVQIAVDEVQRHVVTGDLTDPRIQQLLLGAVREESNPGVRAQSIGVLNSRADTEPVRQALLDALQHDPSAAVRLKALDGLKPYAGESVIRNTLASVLLHDDNAGVRVQAIDLLTRHRDDSIVGVLQDVVQKEDNTYVRAQCQRLLQQMKASVGTY